jgi:hypothetical protein
MDLLKIFNQRVLQNHGHAWKRILLLRIPMTPDEPILFAPT